MKLMSIVLCNFRQFYGQTPEIKLAWGEQNITVIHGNNGAGKTALMNGFTWVLYEKFSAAFAVGEQLVNKRALAEAKSGKKVDCWVEIIFEHDTSRYKVRRACRVYKGENNVEHGKNELFLQISKDDGRWMPSAQHPDDIIGRILPESLHQYFFFDGERIEQIVRHDKKEEIAEATKELLGVEVLSRSIRHLGEAKKSLENDLKTIGGSEIKKLLKEKQKLQEEKDKLLQKQVEVEKELTNQGELKKVVNASLLELSGSAELQKLRNELEMQQTLLKQQNATHLDAIKREISVRGYTIFMSDVAAEFETLIADLREKGELLSGIQRPFLEQLLVQQRCICGAQLVEGSEACKNVTGWMNKAGAGDVEETTIRISDRINEIDRQIADFWDEIDRQQSNISRGRSELSRVESQLDDIHTKLKNFPNGDVSRLQKRLDEIEAKIGDLHRETGSNQQQIESLTAQIVALDKQIDKQQLNEEKQVLAQRRIAASQDAIDRLTEVRSRLEKQFCSHLEKRVQDIFSQISFTPYIPKLSDKYELTLVENTSGKESLVAASTGENQILSLSFIGGIIEGVREWSQKNTLMGPDSSTFPIVMDSPFGSLDEIYRKQIANKLPKLANQLIVLVTKTQWRGEVAQEMESAIGKEYVLEYNSPKADCQEDSIYLGGMRYALVKRSPDEFEYTKIVEVDYGF
ncbi:MAG: AAA family ATPase [Microcoleus sp. PH2017_40_RAT_O_B]|jgi:DNA sulfur modification protein DndD|uniref:AAA family ATPase n=1 Tax=unclassified Microcoleus TaxID=2642155 RepID=UPI001D6A4BCC|nr:MULTISPECIES: AAA family ATPase [unclassified Microcoleus]TAE56623.1 MAG: ATP-binding protein [Oscillatoriales cyanobacterium]MCC3448150.1 AAA family ATPase [Microcoleus sp. PH2017_09_SFU_O_A]MCC3454911.1 AAA family ATPase [Microcoleus sp. PH2017_08_TRC_O_A]MCC3570169.1 AAA family ATPase [Microcoleus sp. PH2017_34_RAT_O_A]MCC3608559.1 AAA family ATPase [Microcoleus sp. PH2017_40_RAT_O_B]